MGWTPKSVAVRVVVVLALVAAPPPAVEARLADELGRNDVRVYSAPFRLEPGLSIVESRLPERLDGRGYRRVGGPPEVPGEYFWGNERFWIYRREHAWDGRRWAAERLRLELDADGRISALAHRLADEEELEPRAPWLEPQLFHEALDPDRARRVPIRLDELPEHAWRAVLAIEDARFFDHPGVDARAVARALLRNARAGRIAEGGSTITQQLIKVRDLSPRRTLGRKASEALRALALEAEHSKEEILEAYLDAVYFGHFDGIEIYGYGAAARAFFSRPAAELDLAQAALLAAMIQGPNRLSPVRHPEAALARQRLVLERMADQGWAEPAAAVAAARALPTLRLSAPEPRPARHFLAWLAEESAERASARAERGRGVVAETWLDPLLQRDAEEAVRRSLADLRRRHRALRGRPLSAALVTADLDSGGVVALVGGDPARPDDFDRARKARRQPGSAVKPLLLLEALEECGAKAPLNAASRLADRPLEIDLPVGSWTPQNDDELFHGIVSVREALARSLNVPLVRLARWCGFDATADRIRRAGYPLPPQPPPSYVLGSIEITPLQLAEVYTAIARRGRSLELSPLRRLARPSGRSIRRYHRGGRRVVSAATAYLVRDLMRGAVEEGTARDARLGAADVFGKTGTSSGRRDAWFVGASGSLLTVVWVGIDDGSPLGLAGGQAAVPLWTEFMRQAVASRAVAAPSPPPRIVSAWVDASTGLRLRRARRGAYEELFRRGAMPQRRRWYRVDSPTTVIE